MGSLNEENFNATHRPAIAALNFTSDSREIITRFIVEPRCFHQARHYNALPVYYSVVEGQSSTRLHVNKHARLNSRLNHVNEKERGIARGKVEM